MLSEELKNIVVMLSQHQTAQNLSLISVSKFMQDLIRLIQLPGIETSVHKLVVDFSKILQLCELKQLQLYEDEDDDD